MRKTLLAGGVALAMLFAAEGQAAEQYKAGVLVGLSGLGAQIGQWMVEGAETAADSLRARGGPDFTIIAEDSQWQPQKGVEGFNKLTTVDGIDVLLSGGSSVMEAIAPLADQRELVVMNVGAQSPRMAGLGKYVFSVLQLSDFDTSVLSRYAYDTLGYRKIATLYVNNDTGTFNQAAFGKAFEKAGGTITTTEAFKPNETTYGIQLAKIRATSPDAIYIVGTPAELPFAVKQTRQMAPGTPILSYAGLESKEFLDAAGSAGDGIVYTTTAFDPGSDAENVKAFADAYQKRYGHAPSSPYAGYGYDAIMIVAAALQKDGGKAGPALRQAIYDMRRFPGVTGENVFRDDGTVAKAVAVKKVEKGGFHTITIVQP